MSEKTDLRLQLSKALSNAGRDAEATQHMRAAIQEQQSWVAKREVGNLLMLYNTLRRAGDFQEAGEILPQLSAELAKLTKAGKGKQIDALETDKLRAEMHLKVGQQLSHF